MATKLPEEVFSKRLEALERSIEKHSVYFFNYFHVRTRNEHDAEDLLQDLWVHVLHRFPDEHLEEFGLIQRKAYQILVDFCRRRNKNPVKSVQTLPEKQVQPDAFHDPDNKEEEDAMMEEFFREYGIELEPQKRKAVWLYARYGHTYAEVGAILGKSANTIGDWIREVRGQFSSNIENS